jgi:flagellar FliL protein
MRILLILAFILIFLPLSAIGEENSQPQKDIKYYRMYPDFVTNLKCGEETCYLLTRVEIATNGAKDLQLVKDNEPLLRDELILLFNAKTKKQVEPGKPRRMVKKEALKLLQEKMQKETGQQIITNILFTKFQVE